MFKFCLFHILQALGMLFWHKHSIEKALTDLPNFTPFPDDWTTEDRVLFEQAFTFHGKSFHRIRQMVLIQVFQNKYTLMHFIHCYIEKCVSLRIITELNLILSFSSAFPLTSHILLLPSGLLPQQVVDYPFSPPPSAWTRQVARMMLLSIETSVH